jgi:hypothetical protein
MVQVLELPLLHPHLFHLFAGPEPGLRDPTVPEIAQFGLYESPQVPRRAVDILFDPMQLSIKADHHPDPEVSRRRHENDLSEIAKTVKKLSGFA